jgi:hypothetical protein
MRRFAAALFAVLLLIPAAYLPCLGDQLPAPKTESVFPGTARIYYANQTFVFTTTVKLSATFEYALPGVIHIRVKTSAQPSGGPSLASGQTLSIYWENGDETLYDGAPPDGEWTGGVQTEGGMTEK